MSILSRRKICLLVCIIFIATLFAAVPSTTSSIVSAAVTVSSIETSADGKGYLEVDGDPFLYMGVQNGGQKTLIGRTTPFATPLPTSFLENYFEKTEYLNFKTIQVIIRWWEIEPDEQGTYDFSVLDDYIDWCDEYDLYLDIVWMGTNACGGSYLTEELSEDRAWRHVAPEWTMDQEKYWDDGHPASTELMFSPQLTGTDSDTLHGWEIDAVSAMFNHLATYDTNHRTIMFQVNNEPNSHPRWSTNKQYVLDRLNDLAEAVKDSNYIVATRVNIYDDVADSDVNDEAYIDCVGADPYTTSVSDIKTIATGTDISDMTYVAENSGEYTNTTSLVLTALVNGGFYDVWQLADISFESGLYNGSTTDYEDWTLETIPARRHSGTDMKNLNAGLNKIGSLIAETSRGYMHGFNIGSDNPSSSCNESVDIGEYNLSFICTNSSVAMALLDSDKLYVVSDTATTATFKVTQEPDSVQKGYLNSSGTWVSEGTRSYTDNGDGTYSITYNDQECLRIDMPISSGIIIDNTDSECTFDSNWSDSDSVTGYIGHNYEHDGSSGTSATKWAKWTPDIPTTGDYNIYMRWTQGVNRPDNAPLEIKYNGGTDTSETVNQQQDGSTWSFIGTYNLSSGTGNYVKLKGTDSGYTIADSVRFEPVTSVSDIVIDNTDNECTFDSNWTDSTYTGGGSFIGTNYEHDGSSGTSPTKWAKWTPDVQTAGNYMISMNWTQGVNRPDAAPIEINYSGGTNGSLTVDQQQNGGSYQDIGVFYLSAGTGNYIKITGADAGYTIADAVKFEYITPVTWDKINDGLSSYTSGWGTAGGGTGSVTQNSGYVTITNGSGAYYMTKSSFSPVSGAFTFQTRAKSNASGTTNEFTIRNGSYQISLYLTHGTSGTAQNTITSPTKTFTLDTTIYHVYRVVVHSNYTYDLYVDGILAWSGAANLGSGTNILKIGGDATPTANMSVDYVKMATGEKTY